MRIALILGILAGLGIVIYRGIYFGPWLEVMKTIGTTLIISVGLCLFFRILASIGSFFVRALLILILVAVILLGGRFLWNFLNPDHPIAMPAAVTNTINRAS